MIKNKIKSSISPLFVIFSIVILYFGNLKSFFIYALVVSLHEIAHYIVSKKLGYKLNKLYLMPYGVCLNYKDNVFNGGDEVCIALAGPAINYLSCIICVSLWWLFPETYYHLDYFCFCNLTLATFNLIPCFPLDGGRIFIGLLSKKFDREKICNVAVILNYVFSFVFVVLFIGSLFGEVNFSFILFAIFLFSGCVNPSKLSSYNYLSLNANRLNIKNGSPVKIFASNCKTPLYKIITKFSKYKFNIVYVVFEGGQIRVLSEINIQNLALKYSPTYSINDIMALKTYKK